MTRQRQIETYAKARGEIVAAAVLFQVNQLCLWPCHETYCKQWSMVIEIVDLPIRIVVNSEFTYCLMINSG